MKKVLAIMLALFLVSAFSIATFDPLSSAMSVKSQGAGNYLISLGTSQLSQLDPKAAKVVGFVLNTKAAAMGELQSQFQTQVLDKNPDLEEVYNTIFQAYQYVANPVDAAKEAMLRKAMENNPDIDQIIELWGQAKQIQTLMQENKAEGDVDFNDEGNIINAELNLGEGEFDLEYFLDIEGANLVTSENLNLQSDDEFVTFTADAEANIEIEGIRPPYLNVGEGSYVKYDKEGNLIEATIYAGSDGGTYFFIDEYYEIPEGGMIRYAEGYVYVDTENREFKILQYDENGISKGSYTIEPYGGQMLIQKYATGLYFSGDFVWTRSNGEQLFIDTPADSYLRIISDIEYYIGPEATVTIFELNIETGLEIINNANHKDLRLSSCSDKTKDFTTNFVNHCLNDNNNYVVEGEGVTTMLVVWVKEEIEPIENEPIVETLIGETYVELDEDDSVDIIVTEGAIIDLADSIHEVIEQQTFIHMVDGKPQLYTLKGMDVTPLEIDLTILEKNSNVNNIIEIKENGETDYGQCEDNNCIMPVHSNNEASSFLDSQ
ncbi:MAG: hypothetical protein ABIF40_03910 [archaeon]